MGNQKLTLYSNLKRYQLSLDRDKTITLGNDNQADVTIMQQNFPLMSLGYKEGWQLSDREGKRELPKGKLIKDAANGILMMLHDAHAYENYDTLGKDEIVISYDVGATLRLSLPDIQLLLRKKEGKWLLSILGSGVYVNNYYKEGKEILLEKGDEISYLDHTLKIFEKEIIATEGLVKASLLSKVHTSRYGFYDDYPDFHRSPRIIYRVPEEKIAVNAPPEVPKKPTDGIIKVILPPLIMLTVTILMAILMPKQGLYTIATAATTVMTVIFSISSYLKTRKEYKQEIINRRESYEDYLSKKVIEIHEANQEQKKGQLYHYPGILELLEMGKMYHHRIYEKVPLHFDFLYYCLGLGELEASSEITYSNKEREKKGDDLEEQGYLLYQNNLKISGMPIAANLVHGPMGYIGPRKLVIEQLQLLVNQLSVFHSYHDLQFVTIFPEEELKDWDWMRWFPHATLLDMNVRGFVYNQRSRDQVLGSLNQILKNRKNAMDENRGSESTIFSPHYVVMVTDEKLILDHVIMEFLNEDPTALGCSVIFVQDVMSSLSENVKTVVDIRDRNTGVLVMEEGNMKNTNFLLDHFPENFDKEELPRLLAPINHLQNLKSSIPESITFMQMYGVERFEELQVMKRWSEHSPHKSLAVPLGLRGQDDVVYLNLHEKAHGPHGLVAGTTGSGKSEIIQSYIISLAVNFHPHDIAFLLIDYKGGGMANLFTSLPHLLGTITNLDGAQSMRALISINAELKRRQRLFSENNVNHINQYQKLYKNGDITAPMPHLFLISDEFAELKAEQPEFMDELVSTARIGRSLGIHLILATQKPSGVVNDQIWSNSKFKLALKVADKADSMEMLKTPDAAEITQAGRAYLQVGNNEIYELFQSAWSGADYQPDKDEQNIEDHTIYRINDLGQYEILSEDLSGLENADEVKQIPTELDAVVNGIRELVSQAGIESLPRPWLPPLEDRIYLPKLHPVDYKRAWEQPKQSLNPVIGVVDIPSKQAQETLSLDITKDGHIAVYSSPGYGKSTFIQTVVMDLARAHNPERLHIYLLDFGTNGLLPLKKLPHVADTMNIDEEEKVTKFTRIMEAQIKRRKKLLSEYSVASLGMYEKASGLEEPIILIPLDGYDGIKGAKFEAALDKLLISIAREGAGVGIHLIISASRQASMRTNLYGNIKIQIPLKMIDDGEARNAVGRTQLVVEDKAGRGLVKLEQPEAIQVALPTKGEDALDIIEAIQEEAEDMSANWTGERPEEIPMIPEVLEFEEFRKKKAVQNQVAVGLLPIGLDFEEVEPVCMDISQCKHVLLVSDKEPSYVKLRKSILDGMIYLSKETKIILIDPEQVLDEFSNKVKTYITGEEKISQFAEMINMEIENRNTNGNRETWVIFIDRFDSFLKKSKIEESEFTKIFEAAPKVGIHLFLAGYYNYIANSFEAIVKYVRPNINQAILSMRLTDQSIFAKPPQSNEIHLKADEGYYLYNSTYIKIKYTN